MIVHTRVVEGHTDSSKQFDAALALYRAREPDLAATICGEILRHEPGHFHALHLSGVIALQTSQVARGVELLQRAISIYPGYAPAHNNLGNGLWELKRTTEALASYDLAIALDPICAEFHCNRGNALTELRRLKEALTCYDRAIALRPDYAEAFSNRAKALVDLGRTKDALAASGRAIALKPNNVTAWGNRALALGKLHRHGEAMEAYAAAHAIEPSFPFIKGMLLYQKLQLCDWRGLDRLIAGIEDDIRDGKMSAEPFAWQSVARSPRSLQRCAEIYSRKRFPDQPARFPHVNSGHRKIIRVGYVSGEFREHATSLLLVGVLEHHARGEFEIHAFDSGWNDGSPTRRRIERAVPNILDISRLSDFEAAASVYARGIDILVNLNGYFGGSRMQLFAMRSAPVQVSYLGFPGTLGAPYIDYLIADRQVIPAEQRDCYAEKIVSLPHSYQCNDRNKPIGRPVAREQCGLPTHGFVYCCFNNSYKILPGMFRLWIRILRQVDGSVLWLLEDNFAAAANLRSTAAMHGLDPARLIFAKRAPLVNHLARHACADLFLDTLPYNAHTTASDALWAGIPVLTIAGDTFPGRVGLSLLNALNMSELAVKTPAEYEAFAVSLGKNPAQLAAMKARLHANRMTTPLFDTASFTRHIETAFRAIMDRYRRSLPPDHIAIAN